MAQRASEDMETGIIEIECSVGKQALRLVLAAVLSHGLHRMSDEGSEEESKHAKEALEFIEFLKLAAEDE